MSRQGALGANVRFRHDTGWEMRCDDCPQSINHWWPLTSEFWVPERSMTRCRACWKKRDANTRREYLRNNPDAAERSRARRRAYWLEARDALTLKQRARRERAAMEKAA